MQVCLMVEGQEDVTWEQWLALAAAAEEAGLDGLFRSDHYGPSRPGRGSLDAWATLAALAVHTSRVRLGTLVSPVTFRHPSELAKVAATVDHVSAGRVELGLGAGWNESEHTAYGFPFPDLGERMELLEEQVEIVHRSWTEDSFSFTGRHYRLDGCEALPKPLQRPRPPLIIGGEAKPRSVALAVRFADEYNTFLASPAEYRERRARLVEACEKAGRDPASLRYSVMATCVVGADRGEVLERTRLVESLFGDPNEDPEDVLRRRADTWLAGTPDEALERLRELADAGVERVYLQHLAHEDIEMVQLVGSELLPAVSEL